VYDDLVQRRAARVPLQHLVGSVGFRWIELEVGPGVFVPRPETESVVQWAVDALKGTSTPLLVDLCAGSGAIALALAQEVPTATVHAVEQDPGALVWARRNADNRVTAGDRRVQLHLADAADALRELDGTVDLVVSNPPYVPDGDLVDPEVADHDPPIAVFGGPDGLDVVRQVEQAARRLLKPGGLVVVEHSDRQGASAPAVFTASGGWTDVEDHQDLTGRDRFVTARRGHAQGER
jgi:release factor glutamine methyltransferase